MDKDLQKRLKSLDIEDFIWFILIGVIILSFYANNIERDFLINKNEIAKEKYRKITILIFFTVLIIYVYYATDSYKSYKNLKPTDSNKKKTNTTLSYLASSLILIAGIIYVYISITDKDLDIELAYN